MNCCLRVILAMSCLTLSVAYAAPQVHLQTSKGDIVLELEANAAPATVENFMNYVKSGAYDGTIFHRVIAEFMIQGGGFDPEYKRTPSEAPITNEADNGLRNLRGTIAMARTNDPHSASNQFFINLVDNDFLDHQSKSPAGWGYCVFGEVVEGMDVVDAIAELPTGPAGPFSSDVPLEGVVIERASIVE